jgi:hypothetical protein
MLGDAPMNESDADKNRPASDFAETIAFLKTSPRYFEGLSENNLQVQFDALPSSVRRLILNLATLEWTEVINLMQQVGIDDRSELDSIRPLVEHFRPLATTAFERMKTRSELRKEYGGIDALRARHLFEMQLGVPVLHLQFLDEDEKVLFESREITPDAMANALGIMVAVAQSFELCRRRKLTPPKSVRENVKDGLTEFLGVVRRIATTLDIPERDLVDALSVSNPPETEVIPQPEQERVKGK